MGALPFKPAALLASVLLLAGCGGGARPSESAAQSSPAGFGLEVVPEVPTGRAIPGQPVVFLVTASGSEADGPVRLSVEAARATPAAEPEALPPGVVGEVTVVPAEVDAEEELVVTITAVRGGIERQQQRTLLVVPGEDALGPEADALLGRFLDWLAVEQPALGIGPETAWQTMPGGWVLVVNHYLYFSDEWEVGLSWHVMVPPDDWARIYLRRRWTEAAPSAAFEIPSVAGQLDPRPMEPPGAVWR